jgi:hypothetical protein
MTAGEPPKEPRGLPPIAVFVALLIVVGAAATYALTRPEGLDPGRALGPAPSTSPPDNSLTDTEAIERFKELDASRVAAYSEADPSRASEIFTQTSTTGAVVQRELRKLRRQGVRSLTRFTTRSLNVIENRAGNIHLRQVVVVDPAFVDSSGEDVTGHASRERQTIKWVLTFERGRWLIEGAVVTRRTAL